MAKKKKKNSYKKEAVRYNTSNFSFEDHVGKVTITKNASPETLKLLNRCKFNCEVVIKE